MMEYEFSFPYTKYILLFATTIHLSNTLSLSLCLRLYTHTAHIHTFLSAGRSLRIALLIFFSNSITNDLNWWRRQSTWIHNEYIYTYTTGRCFSVWSTGLSNGYVSSLAALIDSHFAFRSYLSFVHSIISQLQKSSLIITIIVAIFIRYDGYALSTTGTNVIFTAAVFDNVDERVSVRRGCACVCVVQTQLKLTDEFMSSVCLWAAIVVHDWSEWHKW